MFNVLGAVVILILAAVGYRSRLFQTFTIFLRLVFAFIVAYICRDAFGRLLVSLVSTWGIPFWNFIAFALLFAAVFLALTHASLVYVEADDISFAPIIDRIGGVVVGAASGALLAGILLLTWSMAVSFSPLQFVTEESDLKVDMGQVVLQEFGRLSERIPGNRHFDTAQEVEAYRNADAEAIKKAQAAAPKKTEDEKDKKKKARGGTASEIEDDASSTTLRKKLLGGKE